MLSLALALTLAQTVPLPAEPPPEARFMPQPQPPPPPSLFVRSALATGGGTLAGGVSFALAWLLVGQNQLFDATFATAGLATLLITGVAFTIHEALGGRGEITLGLLLCAALMAGAAGLSSAISNDRLTAPVLTVAIGSLPAAAGAVFGLEGTSPQPRKSGVTVNVGPTGVSGTF